MANDTLKEIAAALKNLDNVAIIPHILADGDALGSSVALCHALLTMGKNAVIVVEDKVPDYLEFLTTDFVISYDQIAQSYDAIVLVDCSDESRFPLRAQLLADAKFTICIDHHETSRKICDLNHIDPKAAATGELIFTLLQDMGVSLDKIIAGALFAAITTDTGNFQYSNTTKRTHEIAMALYDTGFDAYDISVKLYESEPMCKIRLHAETLNNAESFKDGKGLLAIVTQEILRRNDAKIEDTEGIISSMRSIKDVELAVLLKEESYDTVKVSLRSKNVVDVSRLAAKFEGGGHKRAAGFTLKMDIHAAKAIVKEEAAKALCKAF